MELAALRPDDFLRSISPFSGPAIAGQVHSSVVWWNPRCVDHLHSLFPVIAFEWLLVFPFAIDQT